MATTEQPRLDVDARTVRQEANSAHARRRDRRTEAGVCINGVSHGPATDGRLCRRCRLVHRHGRDEGLRLYAAELAATRA